MLNAKADSKPAVPAVRKALDNLASMLKLIKERYVDDLKEGNYERFETKFMTMEGVKKLNGQQPEDGDTLMAKAR